MNISEVVTKERKRILGGAGAIAVAAAGVSGFFLQSSSESTPIESVQLAAESNDIAPALSCDVVQKLDEQTAARAATSRASVPGVELWPPIELGLDPSERPPAAAPIDPVAGVPKSQLQEETPPEALAERKRQETERSNGVAAGRPCGDVVEKIRAETVSQPHATVCYLPDGRFGTTVLVDLIPVDPTASLETRLPQEYFDKLCQSRGWDRSVQ